MVAARVMHPGFCILWSSGFPSRGSVSGCASPKQDPPKSGCVQKCGHRPQYVSMTNPDPPPSPSPYSMLKLSLLPLSHHHLPMENQGLHQEEQFPPRHPKQQGQVECQRHKLQTFSNLSSGNLLFYI